MKKISCKMKNSFAIDNSNILYTWGSHESGLLGREEEADVHVPKKLELKNEHDIYTCESVSSSNFHVAVIANRINTYNAANIDTKYAYQLFDNLNEWYKNVFIKKLSSIESLIKMLLMYNENSTDAIKYQDFENNILISFFNLQNFNKKGLYNVRAVYKEIFSTLLNMSFYKMTFEIDDLLNLLSANSNIEIKEFCNYLKYIFDHFRSFPDYFSYFMLLILRYEKEVDEEIVFNLFQYQSRTKSTMEKNEDKKLISKLLYELRGSNNKVNTNLLIEQILKKQTGFGEVFTWGSFSECRLGYEHIDEENQKDDEVFLQYTPKLVKFPYSLTTIKSISCGYSHTLALSDEGVVYSWGSSKYGCLGNSHSVDNMYALPVLLDFEEKIFKNIIEISAGMYFSLALDSDKLVYSWGCGMSGRLGHGDENTVFSPRRIKYFKNNDIKISVISSGDTHCAVITTAKNVYTWGNGSFGKLGHVDNDDVKVPMFVDFFRDKLVDSIMCGSSNTIVKTTDKKMYGWGKNTNGMLGVLNNTCCNVYVPLEINIYQEDSNEVINNFSLGTLHSMFLSAEGSIYTCGRNINGNLGLNVKDEMIMNPLKIPKIQFFNKLNNDFRVMPLFKNYSPEFSIEIPKNKCVIGLMYIACSSSNTAFITNNNNLYLSGDGSLICETKKDSSKSKDNKINSKLAKYKVMPIKIKHELLQGKVTFVAIGSNHVICIADKKAYSWGVNVCGVLGLESIGLNVKVGKPCLIEKMLSQIKMACVSDTHTMLLTSTGEIYSCGSNLYGKLGIGETRFNETLNGEIQVQYELEPKLVKGVLVAEYIACSNHHSACIMKYSTNSGPAYSIYSWGGGYGGKLGHLDGKDSNIPQMVEIPQYNYDQPLHFVQLALGSEFSIALDTTGNMWGWGKIKYLGLKMKDEGVYVTPKVIHSNHKFKYINCSSIYTLALDTDGNIYGWGKTLSINDKSEFLPFHYVTCDKAELVSCGINHFAAIDSSTLSPYTWGNNLFYKCGQTFAKLGEIEYSYNQEFPKNIQYFNDIFFKHQLKKEENINKEHKKNDYNYITIKNELQINLLEEPIELKDLGMLCEDYKINLRFYQVLKEYFESMKIIGDMKSKKQIETENSIISLINNTKCKKTNEFISEIPKIISKNFQLYEAFFTILHNHPCLFLKVKRILDNKNSFLDLVKNSFGGNGITLKNKRTILALTGLWNSIFKEDYPTLKDSDQYEDFITYDLYHLIFNLDDDNKNVVYDLIAELFILFIDEIIKNSKDFVDPDKEKDILSLYKELPEMRKELFTKVVTVITKRIKNIFSDVRAQNKNKFSFTLLSILKRISRLFSIKNKAQHQSNIENHCKIFNYFLFTPFREFLRKIKESHTNNANVKISKEYLIISKRIPEVLEKAKKKGEYIELYNLYMTNRKALETKYFNLICSPDSNVLCFLFDIFDSIAKNEKFLFTNKLLIDMNECCSSSLNLYKRDFTLSALKELVQSKTVHENESIPISIKIKDMIMIEKTFCRINETQDIEKEENTNESQKVFKVILSQLSSLKKTEELEDGSAIQNFILNFYIKPNLFFYHSDSVDIIKCENCLLPIHSIFFSSEYVEKCIHGEDWKCFYCKASNERELLRCIKCKKLKLKNKNSDSNFIFKNYIIPKDDELTHLYEDALFHLPILNKSDDIINEIIKEKNRLEKQKESKEIKSKKVEIFVNFLEVFNKIIGLAEENNKYIVLKNLKVKELNENVKMNFEKRKRHIPYLNNIKEFINTMSTNAENAKYNYLQTENQANLLIKNIKKGYANSFAKDKVPSYLQKYLRDELQLNKRDIMRRFHCTNLIKRKIIDEILFDNQRQDSLIQKSSIIFEKEEDGYVIKLNYIEKTSKFIVCGKKTNEYMINKDLVTNNHIIEMRKNARHNPTWNSNDVRFNVFYLIKLLNQLETEK